jgi:hypothetical protein
MQVKINKIKKIVFLHTFHITLLITPMFYVS